MSNIKVSVYDKDTLLILEDAKKGDTISLKDLTQIDTSSIEKLLEEGKDLVLAKRLENEKARIKKEFDLEKENSEKELSYKYQGEIDKLKNQLDFASKEAEKNLELEKNKINSQNQIKITELENQIKSLKDTQSQLLENERLKVSQEKDQKINELNSSLTSLKVSLENEALKEKEVLNEKHAQEVEALKKDSLSWQEKYNQLSLTKSKLNIKQLGEELEKWCNQEYEAASLSGFANCTWNKDNEAIKYEEEKKATKADYIFKVFSSEEKIEENLISSVCLEMKNEALESTNKKKNSDHYKKLDEDRKKKGCEYALLVSELEWDSQNDSPIKKVAEYDKMYVVRPQYMISFLSLVYSLANKFKDIINNTNIAKLEVKEKEEILKEFEELKTTYLIKPLDSLEKDITDVLNNNENIIKYAEKNRSSINSIIENRITTMRTKIETYSGEKLNKLTKKIDKLDN